MYRKTLNKSLTLLLILGLGFAGLVSMPRAARADYDPNSEPPPPGGGDPGIGDPDAPDNGRNMPRPVGHGSNQLRSQSTGRTSSVGAQVWVIRFRTVLGVWYRAFFHF